MAGPLIPIKAKVDDQAIGRIVRKLADLDQKVATQSLRKGINEVTKVITKDAKARVPRKTGRLRKALGRKVTTDRNSKRVTGVVGPRANFALVIGGKKVNPAKYAHLVEFGRGVAKKWKTKKGIQADKAAGKVYGTKKRPARPAAPKPFMRPTWAANRRRATEIVTRELRAGVKKAMGRG